MLPNGLLCIKIFWSPLILESAHGLFQVENNVCS